MGCLFVFVAIYACFYNTSVTALVSDTNRAANLSRSHSVRLGDFNALSIAARDFITLFVTVDITVIYVLLCCSIPQRVII